MLTFSAPIFFHLEWRMKISHYTDSQQREQLTTHTVNENDGFTMLVFFFFHLYEESLESSKCLQRTEENVSLLT